MSQISVGYARSRLAGARGCRIRDVRLGHGSFLTFSALALKPAASVSAAAYYSWLHCTSWRLETTNALGCGSEDDRDVIARSVALLENGEVLDVLLDWPSLSLTLASSGDLYLRTFSIYSQEVEHWMVELPSGTWITAGPGSLLREGA